MIELVSAVSAQTERQSAHWAHATARLRLDDLASPEAWTRLERYLGVALRKHLQGVIDRLESDVASLSALQRAARTPAALAEVERKLLGYRRQYVRAETTLDFFTDAINARTNSRTGGLLRACDTLAYRSIAQLLDQLGKATPSVLTYLDKGLGASILKAGLRLWDGGELSPVAAIKIVRHNLLRPTSLIHEAGHQAAHITGWNEELALSLSRGLSGAPAQLAGIWSGWASEIAADAFAFVHTGYASVAALHDVVCDDLASAFRFLPEDPHPIAYLRVLLGVETCRHYYGAGPWDALAAAWKAFHPTARAPADARALVEDSVPHLKRIVEITFDQPMRAFDDKSLSALIRPDRVSPAALDELARRIGPALYTSAHWIWTEPLRITALTGLDVARRPRDLNETLDVQEQAMLRLGGALAAA